MTNSPTIAQPIPTIITQRKRNYSVNGKSYTNLVNIKLNRFLPIERAHSNKQINDICDIPSILTTNVRAIGNKIDENQQVAELNSVGAICVTETWLAPTIPDSNITIPGFNLFRKDRIDTLGGGVCIYLKSTIPCKYLEYCDQIGVESIWLSMRPHKLPRPITSIILAVVYHSTRNCQPENIILRDQIQKNLDLILSKQPNALVIITGDFNPTSTGFKCKDIAQINHLRQLVKFKTRDTGTLDWFFTNRSKLFELVQLAKIGSSDHFSILSKPIRKVQDKPTVRKIKTRDMRDSAWRTLGRYMIQKDWSSVLNATTCENKLNELMSELHSAIDKFLPQRTIKKHPTDRPWITNNIKRLIDKRQNMFIRYGKDSKTYKSLRNKIQREIKTAKKHYYHNRVADVEQTNPQKWWCYGNWYLKGLC